MHRLTLLAAWATPRPAARFLSFLACTAAVPMCLAGAQSTVTSSTDTISARLLQFGIGGGFAKTSANPLSRTTHGFNLQATIALRTPLRPLRLRFDGLLSDAGATQVAGPNGECRALGTRPVGGDTIRAGGWWGICRE